MYHEGGASAYFIILLYFQVFCIQMVFSKCLDIWSLHTEMLHTLYKDNYIIITSITYRMISMAL